MLWLGPEPVEEGCWAQANNSPLIYRLVLCYPGDMPSESENQFTLTPVQRGGRAAQKALTHPFFSQQQSQKSSL